MKKSFFKQKSYQERIKQNISEFKPYKIASKAPTIPKVRFKLKKRDLMPQRVKRAIKELTEASHTFVKRRDSAQSDKIGGYCNTCGKYCDGSDFHAGHWEPNSTGGALLRFHPHNMHGQGGYCCNINRNHQQKMGNSYTLWMINRYGIEYVNKLRELKQRSIKADILFYERLLELYNEGNEQKIADYLNNYE